VFHPRLDFSQGIFFSVSETSLGVPVCEVGDTDSQWSDFVVGEFRLDGKKVLIVKNVIEATMQYATSTAHVFWVTERTPID
jgi:hypothetical protein